MGINYYWTNQWEWRVAPLPNGRIPPLADGDPRRLALGDLVRSVWKRYGGDMMITETAHVGEYRAQWLREVAQESEALLMQGVPLQGVCLYPILGMPEWHAPDTWTRMGLWDLVRGDRQLDRIVHQPMLEALQRARWLNAHCRARDERTAAAG